MIKELFGKIKNKPEDMAQTITPVQSANPAQNPTDMNAPAAQQASQPLPGGIPPKEDVVMEQIKMLIDINKTLNDKTKQLEGRLDNLEQLMAKYAQLIEKLMTGNAQPSAPAQPQAAPAVNPAAQPQAAPSAPQGAATAAQPFAQPAQQPAPAAAATAHMGHRAAPQHQPMRAPAPMPVQQPRAAPHAMPQHRAPAPQPAMNPMTNSAVMASQAAPGASHPLYKNAHEKDFFVLHDGKVLKNSIELLTALKSMNDQTFNYYVNLQKNDFSTWIRYCLNNEILANEVHKANTRADAIRVIESFL